LIGLSSTEPGQRAEVVRDALQAAAEAVAYLPCHRPNAPRRPGRRGSPAGHAARGGGATGQVTALLARDPAACASLGDPEAVARLLGALHAAETTGQVTAARMTAALSAPGPVRYPNCAEVRALPLVGRSSTVSIPSRHLLEPKGPGTGWSAKPLAEVRGRGGA
jgi:hypothetical protein